VSAAECRWVCSTTSANVVDFPVPSYRRAQNAISRRQDLLLLRQRMLFLLRHSHAAAWRPDAGHADLMLPTKRIAMQCSDQRKERRPLFSCRLQQMQVVSKGQIYSSYIEQGKMKIVRKKSIVD
jgi:hypothetical protein